MMEMPMDVLRFVLDDNLSGAKATLLDIGGY
jgi:hypothetical protein